MSEQEHNPETLADRLDRHLPPGGARPAQPSPTDDPLLRAADRLARHQPPELSPQALARIEQRVLARVPGPAPVARRPARGRYLALTAGMAASLALLVGGALVLSRGVFPPALDAPTPAPGVVALPTQAPPTATPTSTPTPPPTATPTLIPAPPELIEVVAVAGDAPLQIVIEPGDDRATPPPDEPLVLPPPSQTRTVVLQGAVERIDADASRFTVAGVQIALPAGDPLLSALRPNDRVRLEGELTHDPAGWRLRLTAVTLRVAPVDPAQPDVIAVETSPDGRDLWRDDGTCANPPPPWARAVGWYRRCQPAPTAPPARPPQSENRPVVPPGQGGNPPGQGGNPPGQGGNPPGQGGNPPGQGGGRPPGQGGGRP